MDVVEEQGGRSMKRIAVVSLLVGLSLAVVFGFVEFFPGVCRAGEKANGAVSPPGKGNSRWDIEWLAFSPSEHQRERQMVMKHEHIRAKDLMKVGKIYIAVADLNEDGIQEIFVYEVAPLSCGTMGCAFNIYQVRGQGLVSLLNLDGDSFPIDIDFDKKGRQNVFGVLRSKTMGWHDIALHEEKTVRWRWKGDHYGGAEPLE